MWALPLPHSAQGSREPVSNVDGSQRLLLCSSVISACGPLLTESV
jgi:hypothetical protein